MPLNLKLTRERYDVELSHRALVGGEKFQTYERKSWSRRTLQRHVNALAREAYDRSGYVRDTTQIDGTVIFARYCSGVVNETMLTIHDFD
ncbi:hypothetical protein [Tsukamurella soli]|uniref:Uncharacterized protein n=1 Tax=Tsukamurella soli TaxID=644556 RepID=A0ABP8JJL5_9ACTN